MQFNQIINFFEKRTCGEKNRKKILKKKKIWVLT